MADSHAAEPEVSEVVRAAQETARKLSEDPAFADRVVAIIDRRLGPNLTTESLGVLAVGLGEYAGWDVTNFILQGATMEDMDQAFLEEDRAQFPAPLVDWLHLLRAKYTDTLYRAQLMSRQNPDDWMYFSREVYFEQQRQAWTVRMTFTKYNGTEFVLAGGPNSAVNLIRELFGLLRSFPNRDVFGSGELEQMTTEMLAFQSEFPAPAQASGDAEPQAVAGATSAADAK